MAALVDAALALLPLQLRDACLICKTRRTTESDGEANNGLAKPVQEFEVQGDAQPAQTLHRESMSILT